MSLTLGASGGGDEVQAASEAAAGHVQAATIAANAEIQSAKTAADAHIQAATIAANAQKETAQIAANVQVETTTLECENRIVVTEMQVDSQNSIAALDSQTRIATTNTQATTQVQTAQLDSTTRIDTANIEATASNYRSDRDYAAAELHEQSENARLQAKFNYLDGKFSLAYGLAQQGLAIANQSGIVTPGLMPLSSAPYVSTRGVLTPGQVQMQVNAAYAKTDARTATLIRTAKADLAGRGFSGNSPLMDALTVGYEAQGLRAATATAASIRITAAQANADQVTKGQSLAVQAWQTSQQVAIDAEKNQISRQVGILGAVANMVGNVG